MVSHTKGQTYILRLFESRVRREVLGPEKVEVRGDWRKQHNEELHELYSSTNVTKVTRLTRMRWAVHAARVEDKNICRLLVGKSEGKRIFEIPRGRWEDNIEIRLEGIRWEGVERINLACFRDIWCECADRIDVAKDREKWWAVV